MKVTGIVVVLLVVSIVGVVCLVKSSSQDSQGIQVVEAPNNASAEAARDLVGLEIDLTTAELALADAGKNLTAAAARNYHTLEVDFDTAEKAVVAVGNRIADVFRKLHITDGCECVGDTCGCCGHLEEEEIYLNATACVNVTYLSQDYGISITATLNKYTIYNETVSARNPPPICVGAPYVKDLADLCLRLHDVEASRRSLRACAAAEARFKHIRLANYELGCFAIGKPMTAAELLASGSTASITGSTASSSVSSTGSTASSSVSSTKSTASSSVSSTESTASSSVSSTESTASSSVSSTESTASSSVSSTGNKAPSVQLFQ